MLLSLSLFATQNPASSSEGADKAELLPVLSVAVRSTLYRH